MNSLIKISTLSLVAFLFIGCAGGGSAPTPPTPIPAPTPIVDPTAPITDPTTGIVYTNPAQFTQTTAGVNTTSQQTRINSDLAHDNGFTGGNLSLTQSYVVAPSDASNRNLQTVVAVLDTGINASHETLSGNKVLGFKDFSTDSNDTAHDDSSGHGTLVSSIIAGNRLDADRTYYGVAYGAQLLVGKVFGAGTNMTTVTNGLNWVATQSDGINVANTKQVTAVNLSLGSSDIGAATSSLKSAMLNVMNKNITVVVAAGNDGKNCSSLTNGECNFVAATPWVNTNDNLTIADFQNKKGGYIVVGSVGADNNISSFSNRAGLTKDNFIVAPGEYIYGASSTINNGYVYANGTSCATPLVSGSLALMAQKWPYLNGAQHTQILFDTATDLGAPGVDDVYGHGMLNLTAAFNPVGTLTIPVSTASVGGTKAVSGTTGISNTKLQTSSAMISIASFTPLNNTIALDSYNRDFQVNMTNTISSTGTTPMDFDNFFSFNYGKALFGFDQAKQKVMLGYNVAEGLNVKATYDNTLLGTQSGGALAIGKANTYYMGVDKTFQQDDLKLKVSGTYAYANADTTSGSLISNVTSVQALGGKVQGSYKGFGVGYAIPLRTVAGDMTFNTPTSINADGIINYTKVKTSLAPDSFEQKYSLFYEKRLPLLSFLAEVSTTKDAFGIAGTINNEAKINLNYCY
jgi:subtilisin family serine protease